MPPTNIESGFDFVQRCESEDDVPALVASFLQTASAFGFEHGAAGAWTGMGPTRTYRFFFNSWPDDWNAMYADRQVFQNDPVIIEAQRRMTPFMWRDLAKHRGLTEKSVNILQLAFEYGWAEGLVVPVHGPAGYQGVVSLATKTLPVIAAADISLLWVMALAIHERCRLATGMGLAAPSPRLTAREIECMRWIAAGKTEWETAQLLGLAAPTVHFHVERVKRRLLTSSRTEAVALLVLHGVL